MLAPMSGHELPGFGGTLHADTPGRMRLWAIGVAIVCVVAGIVGSVAIGNLATDFGEAHDAATQLQRLETVRTAVVQADSAATAAYLEGGLESPTRRRSYEDSLAIAQSGLVDASGAATSEESDRLGEAAAALTEASGFVEQARANSRQGFPVGAAYQRTSSALVRSGVLPIIDEIADATGARATDEAGHGGRTAALVGVAGALTVAALAVASWWLARRTRRILNAGLVAASVAVVGFTVFATSTVAAAGSTATTTIDTSYAAATAYARARTAAFDARSNEALTLIARGNGAPFELEWSQQASLTTQELDRALQAGPVDASDAFAEYVADHTEVRRLDDEGKYDEAVKAALAIGTNGDAFARFDEASDAELERLASDTTSSLDEARGNVTNHRWLVLVAGFVAAAAAFAGIGRRIGEYR